MQKKKSIKFPLQIKEGRLFEVKSEINETSTIYEYLPVKFSRTNDCKYI